MPFVSSTTVSGGRSHTQSSVLKCSRNVSFFRTPPSVQQLAWNHSLASSPLPTLVTRTLDFTTIVASAVPQILISGAPASGKGTQCEIIVERYGVVHISTGDMLRAAVKAETPLGKEAKSYMDSGGLVPDELVISMLKERITKDDCCTRGWLLDGFPRTVVQAKALDEAGILPSAVLLLQVEDDVLIERVVGRRSDPVTGRIYHVRFSPPTDPDVASRLVQRSDDTEEKACVRLEAYHQHSHAIQDHYSTILKRVDGNRSKADVFTDLSNIIDTSVGFKDDQDNTDNGPPGEGAASSDGEPIASTNIGDVKAMPVAEFVRRAEEAYNQGLLSDEDVNWSGQAGAEGRDADGTSNYSDLIQRLDLLLVDITGFLAFSYIGRASHGFSSFDIDVIKTAVPFITAWIVVSPLLGAYTRAATADIRSALKFFSRSWAIAVPMGLGLRGVLTNHVPPAVFAVIVLVATFVIIGSGRTLYVKVRGEETDSARRGGILDGFKMVTTLLRRW